VLSASLGLFRHTGFGEKRRTMHGPWLRKFSVKSRKTFLAQTQSGLNVYFIKCGQKKFWKIKGAWLKPQPLHILSLVSNLIMKFNVFINCKLFWLKNIDDEKWVDKCNVMSQSFIAEVSWVLFHGHTEQK